MEKVKKAANSCVYWTIILMTLLTLILSAARFYTPILAKYRVDMQNYLSNALGSDICIGAMQASWMGARPIIELRDVSIQTKRTHKKILSLRNLSLGIGVWQSIWHMRLQPELLGLDGAEIQISRKGDQPYIIRGFERLLANNQAKDQIQTFDETVPNEVLAWFFNHSEVRLSNIDLVVKTDRVDSSIKIARLKLLNNSQGHHVEGLAFLNEPTQTQLRMIGHFKGNRLADLSGDFYLKLQQLPLNILDEMLPAYNFMLKAGNVDVELWGKWQPQYQISSQAMLSISDAVLLNQTTHVVKKIKFLKGQFAIEHQKNKLRFFVKNLAFNPYLKFNREHSFLVEKDNGKTLIQASNLELSELGQWQHFFNLFEGSPLAKLHFQGHLENAQLQLSDGKPQVFFARLHSVGVHDSHSISLSNVNGDIYLDAEQGYLKLTGDKTSISLPAPYDKALMLTRLDGEFRWKNVGLFWRFTSDRSFFTTDNLEVSSSFVFDWPGNLEDSFLSLSMTVSGKQIEELKAYMPKSGMNQKLRAWLSDALVSVPKLSANLSFKGRLGDFPFDNGDGHVEASLNVEDATLMYHKHWPVATQVDAHVFFDNRKLLAQLQHAMVSGNEATEVSVLIDPLGSDEQSLKLFCQGRFETTNLVNLLLESPLQDKLSTLKLIKFFGSSFLKLNLILPLNNNDDEKKVVGEVVLDGNELRLMESPMTSLTQLKGPLLFDEHGIVNSTLVANLLTYPLSISLSNNSVPPAGLKLTAKGKMAMEALNQQFSLLATKYLKGLFNYKTEIFFPDNNPNTIVHVDSDLKNVQTDLPSPLSKKIGKKQPVHLEAEINSEQVDLKVDLAKRFSSRFLMKKQNAALVLERGQIAFAKSLGQMPMNPSLVLEGKLATFSLTKWRDWLLHHQEDRSLKGLSLPVFAALDIKSLWLYQQHFSNTSIALSPKQQGLQLLFDGEAIKGQVYIPSELYKEGLDIDLERLSLMPIDINRQTNISDLNVNDIPPLNINVQSLVYAGQPLGGLVFESSHNNNELVIKRFELISPIYEMKLIGRWLQQARKNLVEFEGYWQSFALSKVLKSFGVDPIIESKKSLLSFKVHANRSLQEVGIKDLEGSLSLVLNNGQITKLSKEVEQRLGLGKLISILSLQTLPRRLTLDFSDLSNKGFTFDVFKGNFDLSKGNLHTEDSYIDGPVSYVSMKGQLNVLKRNYDLRLKVVPHITASLPVVATIAGGPLAGIAAWVASKIINQGIQKVSSYTYDMKGPWQEPVVHQVSIANVKDKK